MSRRDLKPKAARFRISVPDNVSPHVKLVFAEMQRQGFTYDEMAWVSGVQRAALKAWRVKNYPSLNSLEAVFGALGYDFVPVPRADAIPQDVMAELKPIAERLKITLPEASRFLVEIVSGIHEAVKVKRLPANDEAKTSARKARRGFVHPDQESLFDDAA